MNLFPSYQSIPKQNNWFVRLLVISPLEKTSIFTRIQSTFILLAIFVLFCYELNGRITTNFMIKTLTTPRTIVIGTLNTTTIVISNVVVTLLPLFFNEEIKKEVLEEVANIDRTLSKYLKVKHGVKAYYLHLIILHLVYIGVLTNDAIHFYKSDYFHKYYIWDQLYRYRLSMLVLYVFSFIYSLRQKISGINTILSEELEQIFRQDLDSKLIKHLESVVQDMSETFAKFTNLIRHFNGMLEANNPSLLTHSTNF
ncbi:hypothetical protein QE152_g23280 [Popillia japonica]|uniref:Gustatory receptor n=1 Tax=Popillia japonica TaxID=7064 RepID=A0AAW1KFR9_POPJA